MLATMLVIPSVLNIPVKRNFHLGLSVYRIACRMIGQSDTSCSGVIFSEDGTRGVGVRTNPRYFMFHVQAAAASQLKAFDPRAV